ncbi:hypothetical protein BDQ94DRAFT_175994 [Aspergillus welwitschiae]|uniref:Uncharacterized protein n=1 Tax=Aspergillus welwitschiae TaxID=1341132 RepID=A0A3F3PJD4_9EURO|nr:hypothetical protein BDQ94DRAFT_175994 [Aspergillus welwitschiae]RDH26998.1 hypothetical protein BDQ94DRAFT_175994 [Aspergillus welwitschiae]
MVERTYTGLRENGVHQKGRAESALQIAGPHVQEENILIQPVEKGIGPCQPERNEVGYKVIVVGDSGPRLRRDSMNGAIGETADIQDATRISGLRGWLLLFAIVGGTRNLALDLTQLPGRFDFTPSKLLLQEDLEFLEGGITPDEIQELLQAHALTFPETVNQSQQSLRLVRDALACASWRIYGACRPSRRSDMGCRLPHSVDMYEDTSEMYGLSEKIPP